MKSLVPILFMVFLSVLPAAFAMFSKLGREILRDLRIPRILHYVSLALLGLALASDSALGGELTPESWMEFSIYAIGLAYSAVFAIVTNNLEDLETDRVTNAQRPTVRGTVAPGKYLRAGILCLLIGLLLPAAVGSWSVIGVAGASLGYFIYSCRPFRLKRIPFLSKGIIGLNSFAVALGGFLIVHPHPLQFPWEWALFILLPLSLSANFVDLKDTEGDRIARIATLPVIMGERRALLLIAAFTISSYATSSLLLGKWYLHPVVAVAAVIHLFFLFRKPYNEKPIFLLYVSGLFALDVVLLLKDQLP